MTRRSGRGLTRAAAVSILVHGGVLLAPLPWFAAGPMGGRGASRVIGFELLAYDPGGPVAGPEAPPEPTPEPEPRPPAAPPEPPPVAPSDPELPEATVPDGVFPGRTPDAESASEAAAAGSKAEPGDDPSGSPGGARYRPPRILVGALPLSAEESRALDVPEEIHVRLRIGRDGRVDRVEAVDPDLNPRILAIIRESASAMRFVPARRGREPVEAWFSMAFVFRD